MPRLDPRSGWQPQISDAELLTVAVMQALLGFTSERRWLRYAHAHLRDLFPNSARTVWLQQAATQAGRHHGLAGRAHWVHSTSIVTDDVWVVDSTPVECGRSRETAKRSDLAGWAEYGYCASHSRYFWGLRLHLVCTLHGLPIGWALTGAKADERDVLIEILTATPALASRTQPWAMMIGDKNYYGKAFEAGLDAAGLDLLRPTRKGEQPRPGERFFKPLRQIIESVNDTLKGQLDLEHHHGRTIAGSAPASPNASWP